MEHQYQSPAIDSLLVAKKRKDSAADEPSPQTPTGSGFLNRRLDSSSMAHRSFSNHGSPTRNQDSHAMHMESRIVKEFDTIDATLMSNMTIEIFSDYIARERLSSMPHRGSLWDRVLRWAEFYALQIDAYAKKIGSFVPESHYAARQIYTLLRSLLELGEVNAGALNTTFGIFYKLGLSLSFLSSHEAQLSLSTDIREDVSRAFRDIHLLVFDVASYYQGSVRGLSRSSVTIDFTFLFREHLNNFNNRKNRIMNHIWSHALGGDASRDVHEIRKWLDQRAFLLRSISAESLTYASQYDEYTCEWFQRHLLEFTRSDQDILAITGPPGSGKSVLSSWIQERLQRPLDRKTHSTVMFSFDSDIPSETTSLALAKSLTLQLMDIRLGNVRMFQAVVEAYNSNSSVDMENHLWAAIDAAFSDFAEPTMIIIDGLDQLRDNKKQVCERMARLSSAHHTLRSVILSRPNTLPESDKTWRTFEIRPDHVYEDVQHVAKTQLQSCTALHKKKETERHTILERLVKTANGSFLWLKLAIDVLNLSKLPEDLDKNLEKLPKTLDEIIKQRAGFVDFTDSDVKLLISYMMVTERPLSINELYDVLQVDLQKKINTHRDIDLKSKFEKTYGLLRPNNNGLVKFLHPAIREHFIAVQIKGEKLLPHKEAHTDLTLRLLTYSKACLTKPHDVSLEPLPHGEVERLFIEHDLLEYAVRNWTTHFRQSTLFKPSGPFGFSPEIKAAFPTSPSMPLLEWTCWDAQFPTNELLPVHDLSQRIRSEVFQEKHVVTLQSLVACAYVYHMYSSPASAAPYFVRASRVSQHVLPKWNRITVTLTETFLTITDSMKFTSRTELMTFREEMLKFIVTAYKHTHGDTSDVVIRFTKTLAELYTAIHEEEHATQCWKELHTVITNKHGEGSDFEREISGKLMVVLKGDEDFEVGRYRRDIFAVGDESTVVWDTARIQMFLKLAQACEHRKELHEAEELYVTLWTRLLELCRHESSHSVEVRISMLQIAVEYVHFLRRQQRTEEAKNVLIVIWTEHKHYGCESEAFYQELTAIAKLMRTLELHSLSISVLERVSNFYKAVGKHESSYARECEATMIEVFQESTEKHSSSISRSETSDEMETVVRRMFSSSTTLSTETIKIARSAVHMHMRQERWSEAISLLTRTLDLMKFTGSWGGEVCLPNDYADESIEFALDLGKCYMRSKRHQESLAVYLQLWQAVRSSCGIDDKRRTVILDVLVQNYTEHKRWRALVELQKDLLLEYRRHLGKSHERIIGLLYFLGDLTLEHGHGYPEDYYREIVDIIGTSNTKLSFRAYKRLSQIYYDESNWVELRIVCDVLWTLLTTQTKEHDYDENYVELLYIRYAYVLKHHNRGNGKLDHKHLAIVAQQYRDICVTKFGSSSAVAIRARIEYASVLMEDESTKVEAVNAYEEIITTTKNSKATIDETTMSMVKSRMTEAYVHVHRKGISSAATTEKAIALLQERFQQLKSSHGVAHSEALSVLSELISMRYKTKKTAEDEQSLVRLLQEHTLEILTKEKQSQVLFEAANAISAIYITCGYHAQGLELVQAARRQIISGHSEIKSGFKLDKSVGRIAFVFLVTFELALRGSSHNYSEVMADWLTEAVLYDNYSRSLTTQSKTELLLLRSAHLRSFWVVRSRYEEIEVLDSRVFDIFNKQFGNALKTRPEMIKVFLTALLVHIGSGDAYDIHVVKAASIAGNNKVEELIQKGKYQEAAEVGYCTFQFVMTQGGYQQAGMIGYGFKLAKYMTARGNLPAEMHTKMLQASREVMAEVLNACKALNVNFMQLHDHELNDLVELLGEQENYKELEIILESLWKSRHGQKHWCEDTLINLGVRLVISRHLASSNGHSHGAIHLAEDITYNLRRVLGGLHPHTLKMSTLLSQLYTSAKLYSDALNVHEEIIQLIVSGDDGDDRTIDVVSASTARQQVDLLKAAYQRNGGWVKSPDFYRKLINNLTKMFSKSSEFKNIQPVQEWQAKPDNSTASIGIFEKPQQWMFVVQDDILPLEGGKQIQGTTAEDGFSRAPLPMKKIKQSGWSLRRISDLWGMKQQPSVGNLHAEITY
ncbi:hypothetical protein D6C90_00605 [Aureobasidium pullulans]|uniref:Nephrocystin 3-like N-terminal domain-containing protein n=1 Tax=Aureobasidium pullulans TaxID=5580 RepID=A0A4S9FIT7_AURPU|nr:hypothetical protein D6D21_08561 [Aureobasidium pullulans]THW90372.1 hypothetical protein D6D15_04588 [Aureobasidium pullulans]THX31398.1 hypothetical protein D6D12_02872 [Aureobasidium pullulans]THX47856.1 hypothetical protein D6D11_06267 [Aureobasidium pullulans]THX94929.1 hypothetical protein D6D08_01427 [Aureobasidium pullulans]